MIYRDRYTRTEADAAEFERDHYAEPPERPDPSEYDDPRGRGDGYGPNYAQRASHARRTDLHRIDPDHDLPF